MTNEPDSHVTTRRLTKSWEVGQRRLRFYDFVTDRFGDRSSKTLLTADASFGEDVEGFLNTSIENSLASHLDALEAGTWETKLPWEHERSLLFSLMLQPTRVLAGRGDAASKAELDDLRAKGDAYLDLLARAADDRFRRIGVRLPTGQQLVLPVARVRAVPARRSIESYDVSTNDAKHALLVRAEGSPSARRR